MILADDAGALTAATAAARLAGFGPLPQLGWAQAAELERAAPAVLIAEAAGVADAVLARALPVIAALERDAASAIVVALAAEQIDLVAAHLLGGRVQLLCDPTPADRVSALVIARAASAAAGVRDPASGEEAERLASLAREVVRIGDALSALAMPRAVAGTDTVADRTPGYAGPPAELPVPAVTAADLRAAIRARRLRDSEFGAGWFEDPAWDILLDLFAADLEGTRVSVSSLCIAAAVAPTTALRWITRMTAAGLLVRRDDARDRRRAFIQLSDRARAGMIRHCATVQAGSPAV